MEKNEPKCTNWISLVILEIITLGLGAGAGLLIRDAVQSYNDLVKPAFAPPSWVFPVVWTPLYAAMALSIWFYLRSNAANRGKALLLYFIQLAVNLVWPYLFFIRQAYGLSFVWLLLLLSLVLILTVMSFRAKPISGCLCPTSCGWCSLVY